MDLSERGNGAGRHPWELARARFFRRLVADHVDLAAVRRVLDVGAGDGWFAEDLRAELPSEVSVMCWDANYTVEELQAGLGNDVVRTAVRPAGTFDVVVALDVLEHVEEDEHFLADEIVPAVARGGTAIFSVPAHQWLYSAHDRRMQHVRRYAPGDFRDLIARHLDVAATGSLFTTLVVPRAVDALTQRVGRTVDPNGIGAWQHGRALTRAVTAVLGADAAVGRGLGRIGVHPPGLSVWVVARPRLGTAT